MKKWIARIWMIFMGILVLVVIITTAISDTRFFWVFLTAGIFVVILFISAWAMDNLDG